MQSIRMEQGSEQREHLLRCAAQVKASDLQKAVGAAGAGQSLQEQCKRRFGSKAASLFAKEMELTVRFNVTEVIRDPHGISSVTVVSVRSRKSRLLTLEPGLEKLWKCPTCPVMRSLLLPCKHLGRYLQSLEGVTFETYAAYFHPRWLINTVAPTKTIIKVAIKPAALKQLLACAADDVEEREPTSRNEAAADQNSAAGRGNTECDQGDWDEDGEGFGETSAGKMIIAACNFAYSSHTWRRWRAGKAAAAPLSASTSDYCSLRASG